MQNNFGKWLVASDIDGTLNSKARKLPKRNGEAIDKFIAAGGYFTLASGRPINSLKRAWKTVQTSCPAVALNGGLIYDFKENKIIRKHSIPKAGQDFVKMMSKKYKGFMSVDVGIFGAEKAYVVKRGLFALCQVFFDKVPHKITDFDSIPEDDWCKVIFWGFPPAIKKLKEEAAKHPEVGNFMSSSIVSFEMLAPNVHKGTGVMELAAMLRVDKEHTAAIGDYFNDWDMLKTVGFPACAGQAPKEIHKICKLVACHCNNGCVADLLEHIMSGKAE